MKLLALCLGIALAFSFLSVAQEAALPPQTRVIDGSKEPESIPDTVAWLMLFKVLADGPDALPFDTRVVFLKETELTPGQKTRLILAANRVSERVKEMEGPIMNSSLDMDAKTRRLRAERDAIINGVVNELLIHELPYEAGEDLRRHVREAVKRGIRMVAP